MLHISRLHDPSTDARGEGGHVVVRQRKHAPIPREGGELLLTVGNPGR
jgi:hypothetical protein